MATTVRITQNVTGPGINYLPNDVLSLPNQYAADLIAGGFAIPEGPGPSGSIVTAYEEAGYIPLTPAPSGYVGPSGHLMDVPNGQMGFYVPSSGVITVVFPGRREFAFDMMRLRPQTWTV